MRRDRRTAGSLVSLAALAVCALCTSTAAAMDDLAQAYVKLVLAVGVHDADYVDAYYGPPEWRESAAAARRGLVDLDADAAALLASTAEPRARSGCRGATCACGTRI